MSNIVSSSGRYAEDHYDAFIKQNNPCSAPIFCNGRLTIEAFGSFQRACHRFFSSKLIEPSEMISRVIYNFEHPTLRRYIQNHETELLGLDCFSDFMAHLKDTFLELGWEAPLMVEARLHQEDSRFATWVENLRTANDYLLGTGEEISDKAMRAHIRATMSTELKTSYRAYRLTEDLDAIPDLEKWIQKVQALASALEGTPPTNKRSLASRLSGPPRSSVQPAAIPSTRNSSVPLANRIGPPVPSTPAPVASARPSSSGRPPVRVTAANAKRVHLSMAEIYDALAVLGIPRPPKLDKETKAFLMHHFGCFLCRALYADHQSEDCVPEKNVKLSNWYPPKSDEELKRLRDQFFARRNALNVAAAVMEVDLEDLPLGELLATCNSEVLDGSTPQAEEHIEVNAAFIDPTSFGNTDDSSLFAAAVLYDDGRPAASDSMVLADDGLGDVSLGSDEYVLRPHCSLSSFASSPTPAKDLLTAASAAVSPLPPLSPPFPFRLPLHNLILTFGGIVSRRVHLFDLASRLTLRQFRLSRPLTLGGVGEGKATITHFIKLHVSSPDSVWSARVTRAYVVPNFKFDLILGLDWLRTNKIVVDMDIGSVVAKDSGYDLLHPPLPPCPKPLPRPLSPRKRKLLDFGTARDAMRVVLVELCCKILCRAAVLETDASRRKELEDADAQLKAEYADLFPKDLPHVDTLPEDVHHRIVVTAAEKICVMREYSCPRKWRDSWRTLIDQHVQAGRIRPSSSPYAAPSFLIAKADPSALPRWVIDYRRLNLYTVPDRFPLPRIDDILADCAKGKIWGKIDMTNAFFQTRMHPDDIKYTACRTPFGLYEWTVMPMGLRNSPSTQQRRVTAALRHLIGKICHVYLDDIVIWSDSLEEHFRNVRKVLDALPDPSKVSKILGWPRPQSASDVRRFLGLVKFVAHFLLDLASFTSILYPLTTKACDKLFPSWTPAHQDAFDNIKRLVTSSRVLTTIDHDNPGKNVIFVTCDASLRGTGAVLSWGPSWKDSRPVAFDSQVYHGPERHYPTHEQELLAIIRALKKWRSDLIGMHFEIYTDHKTLLNFDTQKDLSRRQARWMEFLSQYDYKIHYVNGALNVAADALSRIEPPSVSHPIPPPISPLPSDIFVAASCLSGLVVASPPPTLDDNDLDLFCLPSQSSSPGHFHLLAASARLSLSSSLLDDFKAGYSSDPFATKLFSAIEKGSHHSLGVTLNNGLLIVKGRLYVPNHSNLRERLFFLAHDQFGHLGFDKSYANLRDTFYWPNMRTELENAYIPACDLCQRNKSSTHKKPGPLHPLPLPDDRFTSVAIDFVGPLPLDDGFNYLATFTDRLGADVKLVPCRDDMTAEEFARLFLDHWYCDNGCPREIVSDRDHLFTSKFWEAFTSLLDVKRLMSSSFHPETDGASERTNKTVVQCLRFFVERNQTGWVKALPRVRFNLMNSINASTGLSGFQLKSGFSPKILPSAITLPPALDTVAGDRARALLQVVNDNCFEAQDNLLAAKIVQAHYVNGHRANRRRDYVMKGSGRVAKFMPRFDGPFEVLKAHPETSSYTLRLPPRSRIHPTFHVSQLKRFVPNDSSLFPDRTFEEPGPILTEDGTWEHVVDKILDERRRRGKTQYLIRWKGFGADHDEWLDAGELEDNEALDTWENQSLFS
ncbi:hypothetical protein NP233_g5716 [Leucocoprinus birnbaumii]|uniref:RNA-directed DNA polymerase n=1 Tax=Leucocoprinus birnbaumii TaxID=56174 RepID=A0AAD5VTL2_9AGAR|nr:hypothetical protein NP233_g5716 [Leucocoprinus birnbaumii]